MYGLPRMSSTRRCRLPLIFCLTCVASSAATARIGAQTDATPPLTATLLYPPNGAVGVDQQQPARWTSVEGAEAYYLYVGSTRGAKDLIDSFETQRTSFSIAGVPPGVPLYATLHTKKDGIWRHSDSTFTAAPIAPMFLYPTDGAVNVDGTQPFRWVPPAGAVAHQLRVGTSPGGNDLLDTGVMLGTSTVVPGLPARGTLYARALSNANGVWESTDIAFTVDSPSPFSTIVTPADGEPAFDTAWPFEWSAMPLARGYRLTIGSSLGANDLHDSGEIHVTHRFVPHLPRRALFGRLQTKVNGQWYTSDFTFTVAANTVSAPLQIANAVWATEVVRGMALIDNRPFTWTELAGRIAPRLLANCVDYEEMLLQLLGEMNLPLSARRLDAALNPNGYDTHTLVELLNPLTHRWILLDPTFDLTVVRTADGDSATAEDVSNATRSFQWAAVSYVFLGPRGDYYARAYYLDYPLLFVNVYHQGQAWVKGIGAPVLPYFQEVALPMSGPRHVYAVTCGGTAVSHLLVDGIARDAACDGVDGMSYLIDANTIAVATPDTSPAVRLYQPNRYVF